MPFPAGGDCPYASILSSSNKFYTHFGSHFLEFDPAKRAFTFCRRTSPQMAMSMAEDDQGLVWSVTYPLSGVVCFDPKTRELKDYGHVYKQDWAQYPRYVATDDSGWAEWSAMGGGASNSILPRHRGQSPSRIPGGRPSPHLGHFKPSPIFVSLTQVLNQNCLRKADYYNLVPR